MANYTRIIDTRHPNYISDMMYWDAWRECYEGGPDYVTRNLKQFSERESVTDFAIRKDVTPIPSYAKAAVNDIRNSIFQRLRDVTRRDGSAAYMRAAAGEYGGVDNNGSSMQQFIGITALTELLVMGRVGIYVDMPQLTGSTLADVGNKRPYVYYYPVEDILSWAVAKPESPGEYRAVLLRDRGVDYNQTNIPGVELPSGAFTRYRLMWLDDDGYVRMRLYNDESLQVNLYNEVSNEDIQLKLRRIPFAVGNINGSVLKDVYKHQVALLNLGSSDVSYALKANFPFYVEQKDMRAVGEHLKKVVGDDGTSGPANNSRGVTEGKVGITHGRVYDLKAQQPAFINPSSEPLQASIRLQEKLEDDIRKLVNLEVQNKVGSRASSAEALKMSDQGLEAGLSFIGLVLEGLERSIATFWAAYENENTTKQKIATIKYPDRYSLKDDADRIKEAASLSELMYTVPGKTVKKELAKNIVTTLLAGRVSVGRIDEIFEEIDKADYATSNPDVIIKAQEAGLCGEQVASMALGFADDEYLQAREDHVDRAKRILEAQTSVKVDALNQMNAGARGVPDLAADNNEGRMERAEVNDPTLNDDKRVPVRGEGRNNQGRAEDED